MLKDHPSNSTEDRQETLHIILEGELTNFIIITSQGKQDTSFNNNILDARSWDGRVLLRKRIVADRFGFMVWVSFFNSNA